MGMMPNEIMAMGMGMGMGMPGAGMMGFNFDGPGNVLFRYTVYTPPSSTPGFPISWSLRGVSPPQDRAHRAVWRAVCSRACSLECKKYDTELGSCI